MNLTNVNSLYQTILNKTGDDDCLELIDYEERLEMFKKYQDHMETVKQDLLDKYGTTLDEGFTQELASQETKFFQDTNNVQKYCPNPFAEFLVHSPMHARKQVGVKLLKILAKLLFFWHTSNGYETPVIEFIKALRKMKGVSMDSIANRFEAAFTSLDYFLFKYT